MQWCVYRSRDESSTGTGTRKSEDDTSRPRRYEWKAWLKLSSTGCEEGLVKCTIEFGLQHHSKQLLRSVKTYWDNRYRRTRVNKPQEEYVCPHPLYLTLSMFDNKVKL